MSDPYAVRLGIMVRQRRTELGLTQRQVTARGGPAGPVISNVERAVSSTISASTLDKLDIGLGWAAGSSERALTGEVPLVEDVPVDADRSLVPDGFVAVPATAVASLLSTVHALGRLVNDGIDVDALAEARTQLTDLDATLTPIYHRYLTYVIEDHRVRELELPTHLAVVDALLPSPSITDDPSLAEEVRYRRWLVGDTAGLTAATVARFRERLDVRRTLANTDADT
ncbi:helix-turn-helix domain-containing protein [Rhodococcoides fascians]|uniref:helix-turn-helix domain-containing protein n=1 Tax=Rhodococcoides fascians TaxID=1828 RepID=UPI0012FDE783|nr:helix-turn-helix domain-containing protein [Rhodococcus fascians]